jgi:hypothetical protein
MKGLFTILFMCVLTCNAQFGIIATSRNDSAALALKGLGSITNSQYNSALNILCKDIKGYKLWNNYYAIYPFIGATSTACSYNIKNFASFNLTYVNSPSFSFKGMKVNGTNQYANTNFSGNTNSTTSDIMNYDVYLDSGQVVLGAISNAGGSPLPSWYISYNIAAASQYNYDAYNTSSSLYPGNNGRLVFSYATLTGDIIGNRNSSSNNIYIRDTLAGTTSNTSTNLANTVSGNSYIGALYYSGGNFYNAGIYSFVGLRKTTLTSSQVSTLSTLLNRCQTTLGRNVY